MFKDVILVIGMPRSGTSWLGQIFDSSPQVAFRLSPLFSYALKNIVNENSSKTDYKDMFIKAYQATDDEFMNQYNRRKAGHYPIFQKKITSAKFLVIKDTRYHNLLNRMLELFDNLKAVAIVRHPCGAIHSWLTHPKEFPPSTNPMEEWRTGACRKTGPEEFWGFNDWMKVTRLHVELEQAYPKKFYIIQYENLVKDPMLYTRRLFDFMDLKYTKQTQDFLIASQQTHDQDLYAVYKNPEKMDRWRHELAPEIQNEIIQEIQSSDLTRFLV